MEQYETQ